MTQVIERVKAHYEVQEVEMGTVYRWCPESAVIECDCRQSLTVEGAKEASCPRCGAEHRAKLLLDEHVGDPLEEEKLGTTYEVGQYGYTFS